MYTDLWNAGQFIFNGGVTPVVGVGGNILGGGRGFLGRKYGYAIDQASKLLYHPQAIFLINGIKLLFRWSL